MLKRLLGQAKAQEVDVGTFGGYLCGRPEANFRLTG